MTALANTKENNANTALTLDQKINSLKPGQEIIISQGPQGRKGGYCTAERGSGANSNKLRFVRHKPNGSWEVFKTCTF